MHIKKHSYIILKYLSNYDTNALIRRDQVYTQLNISEVNFNKTIAVCFAFGFTHGSKPYIGITAKGRLYLEELEKNL